MKKGCRLFLIGIIAPILLGVGDVETYAATIEDIREISGIGRLSELYTKREKEEIKRQYRLIQTYNMYVDMFELMNSIDLNTESRRERLALREEEQQKEQEFRRSFQEGGEVGEVLREYAELEGVRYEITRVREERGDIVLDRRGEDIVEKYRQVMSVEKQIEQDKEIGVIGKRMQPPLHSGFLLGKPYREGEGVVFKGLEGDKAKALWGGEVKQVSGGIVRIKHGEGLESLYRGIERVSVRQGQDIEQYDVLGLLDNDLTLQVWVDGKEVNPLYIFGREGLRAYQQYVSYNPFWNRDMQKMKEHIDTYEKKKERQKAEEKQEEVIVNGSFSYARPLYTREELDSIAGEELEE